MRDVFKAINKFVYSENTGGTAMSIGLINNSNNYITV